jgi:hypothetical protein
MMASMTDDEIRALLLSLKGRRFSPFAGPLPDTAIVNREDVTEAGTDVSEIDAWVTTHGGRIHAQAGAESRALEGRWTHRTTETSHWYLVPMAALDGERP